MSFVLTKEKGLRMWGGGGVTKSGSGGGGAGGGGGISAGWVEENFISKDFFNQLFTVKATVTHEVEGEPVTEEIDLLPNSLADGTITAINSVKVETGLWTDAFLSALGLNPGGGGGGTSLNEPLQSINDAQLGVPQESGVAIMWNGSAWTYQVPSGGGGAGTVTSVGMSVPTGFAVSGGPITGSGTLALTFATGYSLPTTAKQSNWDTAYRNSHTHGNYNVLDGITSTQVDNWDTAYGWGDHAQVGYLTEETDPTVPAWAKASTKPSYSFTEITGTASSNQIPNLSASKITSGTLDAARLPDLSGTYAAVGRVSTLEGYFTSGSAKTAVKLNTARNLWGQSFDGSADVSGNMTSVGNVTMTTADGRYIQIGGIRIVYDETNNALKVVGSDGTTAANFYATGGVSALGQVSGGSGGAGALYECTDVKPNSQGTAVYGASEGKVLMYGSDGKWYAGEVTSSGGTVTSVGLSVPTGFKVSGDTSQTIINNGTFALTFDTGYSLPTTTKQGQWDNAYAFTSASNFGTAGSDYIPITLGGTTQNVLTSHQSLAGYLPLTAGSSKKLTGSLYLNNYGMGIYVKDPANNYVPVFYQNSQNLWIGAEQTTATHHRGATYISAGHDGTSGYSTIYVCVPNDANNGGTNYGVWHSGNFNPSEYATQSWVTGLGYLTTETDPTVPAWAKASTKPSYSFSEITGTVSSSQLPDLSGTYATTGRVSTLEGYFSSGSAKTAVKLNTARSLWGQSFDGSADVNGNLCLFPSSGDVTSNSAKLEFRTLAGSQYDSYIYAPYIQAVYVDTYGRKRLSVFQKSEADWTTEQVEVFTILPTGNVGVGTTTPAEKLTVVGNIATATSNGAYIQIGGARLVWDNTSKSIYVVQSDGTTAANFYATGGVSALGQVSGGSGGAGALYECTDVKPNSQGTAVYGASEGKVLMYGSDGKWYAGEVTSSGGTVTSVGLSVPTGFKVSGDTSQTIINNGTFALTFDTGYSLPTTTKQGQWDNAYAFTSASNFGTAGSDYIPITLGGTTQNVLTSHQSLAGYLPLTAGSGKKLTGSLYLNNYGMGIYVKDPASNYVPVFYQNSLNLWIGAEQTMATHHNGATYISAGHDGSAGNSTIYVCVPNAANNGGTNYGVWHSGNFNPSEYATQTWVNDQVFVKHVTVGTNDLTGYSGSFFFGGSGAIQSGYDYVGFQAGSSNDKWQLTLIDSLIYRQNDNGGTDSTHWTAWRTLLDSNNYTSYLTAYATQSWVSAQGYLTGSSSIAFSQLPAMYWANVRVDSASSLTTEPQFANLTLRNGSATYGSSLYFGDRGCYIVEHSQDFLLYNAENGHKFTTMDYDPLEITAAGYVYVHSDGGLSGNGLRIGDAILEWDSTNNALKLRKSSGANDAVNFYATGGVSALGTGSGGSGGAGALYDCTDVKPNSQGTAVYGASEGKVLMYGSDGKWYAGTVSSGSGTVTSVGLSVPTGFKVSGDTSQTIINNGTFALTFATGYSLPTTAKQTSWDTAASGVSTLQGYFSSGSAKTAVKLNTERSLWGQSFDGSADVKGDLCLYPSSGNVNSNSAKLEFRTLAGSQYASYIYAPYIQGINVTNYGRQRLGFFQKNNEDWTTAQVEVMSILPDGKVGINTTQPTEWLEVNGDAKIANLRLQSGTANYGSYLRFGDRQLCFLCEDSDDHLQVYGNDGIEFSTQDYDPMEITDDGYVHVRSDGGSTGVGLRVGNVVLKWDSANNALKIEKYGGGSVNVVVSGGVAALG